MRIFKRDTYKDGGHEADWCPAKHIGKVKGKNQGAYEWITQGVPKKRNMRDPENGKEIMTAPNNILNNPMKVGRVARRGDKFED